MKRSASDLSHYPPVSPWILTKVQDDEGLVIPIEATPRVLGAFPVVILSRATACVLGAFTVVILSGAKNLLFITPKATVMSGNPTAGSFGFASG